MPGKLDLGNDHDVTRGRIGDDLRDVRAGLAELSAVFEKRIEAMAGLGAF